MEKVKFSEKKYGVAWYKAKEKQSGINVFMQRVKKEDEYIVKRHHPTYGLYWGCATQDKIAKMLQKNVYLYEILEPDVKKKVYFDIDKAERDEQLLENCKKIILEAFPDAKLQISGSITDTKTSYHIIVSNYYVYSTSSLKIFASGHENFDTAVYSKFQSFKCINQSKPKEDAPIQEFIEGDSDLTKHLVLTNFDDNAKEAEFKNDWRSVKGRTNSSHTPIDLLSINPDDAFNELPIDFDYINATALKKLNVIPLAPRPNTLDHNVIWKIMTWAKCEGIAFNDFWNWCKQKEDTEERKFRYMSYWSASENYCVSEKFIDTLLLKYYPYLKEDRTKKMYRLLNTVHPTHIITAKYLSSDHINDDVKTSVLSIRMGGNKTGAVIDKIKHSYNNDKVLFISPRVALSHDIRERMKQNGLDFELYTNFKDKSQLKYVERLIVCINSLKHLADTKYDVIIVDEIETIWNVFSNDAKTLKNEASAIWCLFMRLLREAKKVIVMDALLSGKTLKVLEKNDPQATREILTLEQQQEPRQIYKYKPQEERIWLNAIKQSVERGEKIFVFMPYKSTYSYTKRNKLLGARQLIDWLCEECNLKEDEDIIGYWADQKEQKKALKNINDVWGRAKVIVGNTCISVGNNYSGDDYTRIFGYFSNWVNIRDFMQVLYRIRHPKDKVMHIYYEKRYVSNDRYCRHKLMIEDEAFKELKTGFLIEDQTDGKMRLELMISKCNITLASKNDLYDKAKSIKLNLSKDFSINFESIMDISESEYNVHRTNIESGFCSLQQRLEYEKYRLKKKFAKDTPPRILEIFWETSEDVLNGLYEIRKNPNCIINKLIQELNYEDTMKFFQECTATEVSTMYVPKCVTNDMIKQHFNLKNEIENRGVYMVARLINAFFGERVMYIENDRDTKKDKWIMIRKYNRTVKKYVIDEKFKEIVMLYEDFNKSKPKDVECEIE